MAPQKTMFGDIVRPSVNVGTRRWYTVPLSIAIHAAAILAAVIIPLMAYDVLPRHTRRWIVFGPSRSLRRPRLRRLARRPSP